MDCTILSYGLTDLHKLFFWGHFQKKIAMEIHGYHLLTKFLMDPHISGFLWALRDNSGPKPGLIAETTG